MFCAEKNGVQDKCQNDQHTQNDGDGVGQLRCFPRITLGKGCP